jgi:hypothetical protein
MGTDDLTGWRWVLMYASDRAGWGHQELAHFGTFPPTDQAPGEPEQAAAAIAHLTRLGIPVKSQVFPVWDGEAPDVPTWDEWVFGEQFVRLVTAARMPVVQRLVDAQLGERVRLCGEYGCADDVRYAFEWATKYVAAIDTTLPEGWTV